jgi:glycerol kinase
MRFQAGVANVVAERPVDIESTGRGAAMLAGLGADLYRGLEDVAKMVSVGARFEPAMSADERAAHLSRWNTAVQRTRAR